MPVDYADLVIPRGYEISNAQIRALTAFARIEQLPPTYEAFLRHSNGSEPNHHQLDFTSTFGPETAHISHFYASDRGRLSVMSTTDDLWGQYRLPRSCLCIAEDANGNFLVLSLEETSFGAIYFWDHESGHTDHSDDDGIDDFSGQLTLIAASIDELLQAILVTSK